MATVGTSLAAVHYVDVNSTNPAPPYTSWAAAATNIQDAVDAAVAGDEIVVTNGIYATGGRAASGVITVAETNRVLVEKPLTVRSVNGPQFTMIDGGGSVRCVALTNGVTFSGFTLTNGLGNGGGGAYGGTVNNCWLNGNRAYGADGFPGVGGGALDATLNNCTLQGNSADVGGGAYRGTLNNCTLKANAAADGGGAAGGSLNNCTLTENSATARGYQSGGAAGSVLRNCILYQNFPGPDFPLRATGDFDGYCSLDHCCTTARADGFGNITNAPLFVDAADGNLRLQSNSPCINAGNNAFAARATDLDRNPRISAGTVDIGAYEFQSPTSIISYAWLQQYGLPADGSADYADPDGDGMNNWGEWRCGTDPTNALSALRLLAPVAAGTNVFVSWQSVAGVNYFLERSTNLVVSSAFTAVATSIPGVPGTTSYTDTNAVGVGPRFYRVGVSSP